MKLYSYQDMVVLNDKGFQVDIINGEIFDKSTVMFAPNRILQTDFIKGTVEIFECEVDCGQITGTKRIDSLCDISELFEVSEEEAKKIIESKIDTISWFLTLHNGRA